MPDPRIDDVRVANQRFYDAHEARDVGGIIDVWEHSDRVVCIHPGWPILRTWPTVLESWRRICRGPGRNQFILTNEVITLDGTLAIVTVDENLVGSGADFGTGTGTVAATNVYAHSDDRWQLILHHGSPVVSASRA